MLKSKVLDSDFYIILTQNPSNNIVIISNPNIDLTEGIAFLKNQYLFEHNPEFIKEGKIWMPTFKIYTQEQMLSEDKKFAGRISLSIQYPIVKNFVKRLNKSEATIIKSDFILVLLHLDDKLNTIQSIFSGIIKKDQFKLS